MKIINWFVVLFFLFDIKGNLFTEVCADIAYNLRLKWLKKNEQLEDVENAWKQYAKDILKKMKVDNYEQISIKKLKISKEIINSGGGSWDQNTKTISLYIPQEQTEKELEDCTIERKLYFKHHVSHEAIRFTICHECAHAKLQHSVITLEKTVGYVASLIGGAMVGICFKEYLQHENSSHKFLGAMQGISQLSATSAISFAVFLHGRYKSRLEEIQADELATKTLLENNDTEAVKVKMAADVGAVSDQLNLYIQQRNDWNQQRDKGARLILNGFIFELVFAENAIKPSLGKLIGWQPDYSLSTLTHTHPQNAERYFRIKALLDAYLEKQKKS